MEDSQGGLGMNHVIESRTGAWILFLVSVSTFLTLLVR